MKATYDVVIVGGGASGFFCATRLLELNPSLQCLILEKTAKTLSKVRVSGGGRCNVTNRETHPKKLATHYPRGEKFLTPLFKKFGSKELQEWFEAKGIELKTEADGRIFPQSNTSQTIIDTLSEVLNTPSCSIKQSFTVNQLQKENDVWEVSSDDETITCTHLVLSTGGINKQLSKLLKQVAVKTIPPAPSLFTFKLPLKEATLKEMQGVAVQNVQTKIVGTKITSNGPLLFTHWGLSGPAILKLSAWGAKILAEKEYQFTIHINFVNRSFDETKAAFEQFRIDEPKKQMKNIAPFDLPKRAWLFILEKAAINPNDLLLDISGKKLNKLATELSQSEFEVTGKSTFKDEFVTAGGVDLNDINRNQCEHKTLQNLYFTGELLDIDAITGGFNFQGCWTTADTVAKAIAAKSSI